MTADSVAGWDRRERLASATAALAEELTRTRHDAEVAAWELRRLRARRWVALGRVVPAIRKDGLRGAVRAFRSVLSPPHVGRRPESPEVAAPPQPVVTAPFEHLRGYDHPHLRVGHVGASARYAACAPHVALDPDGWRDEIDGGLDLLLVEAPSDGELPPWVPQMLDAARARELPVVLVTEEGADVAPEVGDVADLRLVETVAAHDRDADAGRVTHPPTIDPAAFNPTGWRSVAPDPVIAVITAARPSASVLATLAGFEPPVGVVVTADVEFDGLPDGLSVLRTIDDPKRLIRSLGRASVLLDHPDLHDGATSASRLRAAAAASGVAVIALEPSVPEPDRPLVVAASPATAIGITHRLLTDLDERERQSICARRAALSTRDHAAAFGAVLAGLGIGRIRRPLVSVIVSTNRPSHVEHAMRSFHAQRYPNKELVLVLHGDGFPTEVPTVDGLEPAAVLRVPPGLTLGDCLNAGIDASRGDLVAKMDDDDHYGPHHLGDLVLAQRYSGADLVGKRVEFVHVAAREVTVRRPPRRAERYISHVSGPTLLMTVDVARRVRFRPLPRRVDSTLCERIIELGGRIYRTHSRDIVLERHGDAHTWDIDADDLVADAADSRDGLALDWASSHHDAADAASSGPGT